MKLLIIFLTAFLTFSLCAEEIRKGTVQAQKLRMRSKPGTKYEVVGQLKKGDAVKVVEEQEGWLKIVAPESVEAWISSKFVSDGVVTGNRINVRAGPSVAYNNFGKLNKGDKVEVIEVKDKIWAKIKGSPKLHVWVSSTYVKLEPLIVARDDEKNDALNDVKAVADKDDPKMTEVAKLKKELDKEKKAAEDAKKLLEEEKKKLARLEEEKIAAAKKVEFIEKLLEIEKKKKSKKLVLNLKANDEIFIGSQKVAFEEISNYYKAAGDKTIVFIKSEKDVKEATVLKVVELFKELKAEVYLEDPSKLLDPDVSTISDEFKNKDGKALKTYMTLTVKKPKLMFIDTVKIPEEHLESILKTYGKNFGESNVYIQAEKGVDPVLLDRIMRSVQESGFKVITYPAGADGHEVTEVLPDTVVEEKVLPVNEDEEIPLPPGRIRMTGYLLNVDTKDRHIVDFALAVKVNGEFYAIAFLKGMSNELKDFYLKEVEIIGVQKRLEGWTRPLVFVENFKQVK
ncbi:MAG: SH3 domain-containing protein [Lentisphaeraceae bacterium]|nr:SH3 domain-containing protein [Lentisphaeraceae bacterium]